ncbi:unnamed protein product [Acanthoscelides obtectus]|uniref:Uncharacterized protein n=1 Tax=Acanthoscelides obtectus TaxID=200917 RepID=A0A9P0LW87_ACAOB|nr:unnamed protein product [Acanthoscelides obtectus]CAK1683793.1 hypothetical protein AOBTE_LOCUS34460 [Acanthoscelides obtectus]
MQTVDGKKRLTVDWQNVIGDQVCGSGKFSIFRTLAYNRFVDNYGQVEFNMGRTRYCTGSSYEGSANALADTKRIRTLDNKILRVVSCKEEAIIKNEFKRGGDHNVGLKRDLYEHWILGRQNEVEQILAVDDASTSDHIESRHLFDQPENISDCTLVHY